MPSVNTRHLRIKQAVRRIANGRPAVQRQDSTTDQLTDLWILATKCGMYDAADWLWKNAKLESHV